jgi:DNA (cytosine-5)-methyltransferase 1
MVSILGDYSYTFPKPIPLKLKLKDLLEDEVDEKYYLSDKLLNWIDKHREKRDSSNKYPLEENDLSGCITARYAKNGAEDSYVKQLKTKQDTISIADYRADEGLRIRNDGNSPCITSSIRHTEEWKPKAGTRNPPLVIYNNVKIGAIRGRNPENPKSRKAGLETEQMLEINENEISNTLTTVQKDNVLVYDLPKEKKIRRLTPRECFRLMDFPETFDFSVVSNSQAYKQAGNSIVVNVLCEIIKKLKLN